MKKITLKNLNFKEVEQLSREQLKNVLGGYIGGTGSEGGGTQASCFADCTCPSGYKVKGSDQTKYGVGILCNEGESCASTPGEGVICSGGSEVLCDDSLNCEKLPVLV